MKRLAALMLALWLGTQVGVFIAAVVLFEQLPKVDAGRIAGILFHIPNSIGLVIWLLLWWMCRQRLGVSVYEYSLKVVRRWIVLLYIMLLVSEFIFNPVIAALKAHKSHFLVDLLGGSFGMWHGVSYIWFLLMSVVGLGLCIRLLKLDIR